MKRNWKKRLAVSTVILASLFGLGHGFVYWDPTRTLWLRVKRIKAPHRFEKINPRHLKTDPAKLIAIRSGDEEKQLPRPQYHAPMVRAGEGRFDVLVAETHARHKISSFAQEAILKDMARP